MLAVTIATLARMAYICLPQQKLRGMLKKNVPGPVKSAINLLPLHS
jgi:hypothetical protein